LSSREFSQIPCTDPGALLSKLSGVPRIVFDLDGTLYDARDFERPALMSVVEWLKVCTGRPLNGLLQSLWKRRETDRHRPGMFDELLVEFGLPAAWGSECATRFREYAGTELLSVPTLRQELIALRSGNCGLALVSNGRPSLQQRKLELLGLESIFDVCIFCDPEVPAQLKPSSWGWIQLEAWRSELPAAHVGDDPVDAGFAQEGAAQFLHFAFRNPIYEH